MKSDETGLNRPMWKRLLWFGAIWAGSVLMLGLIATAIRYVLHP